MALKLCNGCERHVHESDAVCPYCGSTETAQVPAPTRVNRKAMGFAAAVLTTVAVETVACSAVYGAPVEPIDCEEQDCGYAARCRPRTLSSMGTGSFRIANQACTEESYQAIFQACFRQGGGTECSSTAFPQPACARCLLGPRDREAPTDVSPGALLSRAPLLVNTGACAAVALGRPNCASHLTAYDFRVAEYCADCSDPGSFSACRADQATAFSGVDKVGAQAVSECIALRDQGRAEWEPVCVGASPEETLDKVARVLCFGQ